MISSEDYFGESEIQTNILLDKKIYLVTFSILIGNAKGVKNEN